MTRTGAATAACKTAQYEGSRLNGHGAESRNGAGSSKLEEMLGLRQNPNRLDWEDVWRRFVGKRFTRRTGGHTLTLHVIDSTLGGDVVVRQRGLPRRVMHQSLFMQWLGITVEQARLDVMRAAVK